MKRPGGELLLVDVLAFIAENAMTDTEFGILAVNSPQLVATMKKGSRCGVGRETRIRAFMARGKPQRETRGGFHARRYREAVKRNKASEAKAEERRKTDPVELAKTFIRRRTPFCCFDAHITRPEFLGMYFIGARLVDREGLLNYARERGWEGQ